jgi:hypothetical protein
MEAAPTKVAARVKLELKSSPASLQNSVAKIAVPPLSALAGTVIVRVPAEKLAKVGMAGWEGTLAARTAASAE